MSDSTLSAPGRPTNAPGPQPKSKLARVVGASMAGTVVEWYEFFLYATAATLVFGDLFFPKTGNPLDGVIAAMLTYAVGFVARPLGGVVFGHFGDKHGRKQLLQVSLLLVGGTTFCMGLLPGFDQIGYIAPILLVGLRFVQGFAVGGEWGGAVLLIAEHSPDHRRGFYASFPQAAVPIGNLLATGVLLLLNAVLSEDAFLSWGWRIAFFLSVAIVLVGWYIRKQVEDADIFKNAMRRAEDTKASSAPLIEVLRKHPRNILTAMGARVVENIWYYIVVTFSITYLDHLGVSTDLILQLLLVAHLANVFVIPLVGHISDKVGRRPVYIVGVILAGVHAFAMFPLFDTKNPVLGFVGIALGLFIWSVMYAPQPALLAEMFPTRMRYSGVSISYQVTAIFAGSLAPVIATSMLRDTGSWVPITGYIAVAAVVSLVSACFIRETKGVSLHDVDHELDETAPSRAATETLQTRH
ncbi:MFS transporter [uncultured Tessaracoccus sp.]|uniref:MFS transporter n=1 Tax=uncultured Tessaracoccus sp. TaxID=905023 RepID=UPI0025FF5B59|nr:MFS transporter [uncultured Tessaracoccus sp.]